MYIYPHLRIGLGSFATFGLSVRPCVAVETAELQLELGLELGIGIGIGIGNSLCRK